MKAPQSPQAFADRLRKLHTRRRERTTEFRTQGRSRSVLTSSQRNEILSKTGNRCHVCGIKIKKSESWHADHVLPHSGGGKSVIDNYLPSCALCNRNRWHMLPEEIQAVLKLGVFVKHEIEKDTALGQRLAEQYVKREQRRQKRLS
jgi:hypothetical protein